MNSEEATVSKFVGHVFAAINDKGEAVSWCPKYEKKTKHTDAMITIAKRCLETAPIASRLDCANHTLLWCREIRFGCDDHDLSIASFHVKTGEVNTGSKQYLDAEMKKAVQLTIKELLDYSDGVEDGE